MIVIKDKTYRLSFALAVLFHSLLVIALFIKFTSNVSAPASENAAAIIQATIVNSANIDAPVIKTETPPHPQSKPIEKSIIIPKPQLQQQQKQQEQQIKQEKLLHQEQMAKKIEEQKIAREHLQMQALLKQHLAAEQLKEEKALQQKIQQEKQAATKQKQKLMQKLLQQQLSQEETQLSKAAATLKAAQSKQASQTQAQAKSLPSKGSAINLSEIEKYKALIIQAISQEWVVPPDIDKDATCILLIKLAPGGDVLNIQVLKSSGNDTLDRSAKVAVMQASPLPVPKDLAIFDSFRTLKLTVHPTNIGL